MAIKRGAVVSDGTYVLPGKGSITRLTIIKGTATPILKKIVYCLLFIQVYLSQLQSTTSLILHLCVILVISIRVIITCISICVIIITCISITFYFSLCVSCINAVFINITNSASLNSFIIITIFLNTTEFIKFTVVITYLIVFMHCNVIHAQ